MRPDKLSEAYLYEHLAQPPPFALPKDDRVIGTLIGSLTTALVSSAPRKYLGAALFHPS